MLRKIAIFKALDVEIKKQRGPAAVKEAYRGHHSLKEELSQPGITVIAEVAGGNPLRGQIRESYRAATHAKSLVENGARAISVATDRFLYFGEDKHLSEVRGQVKNPLLRRDFILEEYQVEESKILGADAISLVAALLTVERMQALLKLAAMKSLDVVVEVTSEQELQKAIEAGTDLICVVGRNLDTWEPSWDAAIALLKKVPAKKCLRMVECGVNTLAQIKQLESMGVHGVIIGDALLDEFYPGKRLAQILAGIEPTKKPSKPKAKAIEVPAVIAKKETEIKVKENSAQSAKLPTLKATSPSSTSNPARKGPKEPKMAQNETATPGMTAPPTVVAKKPAAKKAAPKKAAAKKPAAKKAAPKKVVAKKAAPKKAAAKKAAPKKVVAKKVAPKKAVAKKAAPKKAVAKKVAPKKAVAKKAAPKKAVAKKAAPKKVVAKKVAPKKVVAKKAAPKKVAAKKPAAKKAAVKKPVKK
jgi:indole-3-glycerol phosphate synthase